MMGLGVGSLGSNSLSAVMLMGWPWEASVPQFNPPHKAVLKLTCYFVFLEEGQDINTIVK